MITPLRRFLGALVLVMFVGQPALAAGAVAAHPAAIPPATADALTHHTLELHGRTLVYTARAGTITLRSQDDQPTLRMFYTAYTLDGAQPSHRALTFVYNGGPGSSTMWLRMGSIGPVHVQVPDGSITPPAPYDVSDNPNSLLDKTDLVFVDMPTSGFGRLIGAGKAKDFYGIDKDAHAFAQFITRYITTFGRWNSPKFLFGESYGTTRSAVLVNLLQQQGVGMSGVVLLSSILNFDLDFAADDYEDYQGASGEGDWPFVFYLPTEAATAWYHHAVPGAPSDLHQFLGEAEHFAMTQYRDALAKGAQISRAEFDDTVRKLHQ